MDPSLQHERSRRVCGFIQFCPGLQCWSCTFTGFPCENRQIERWEKGCTSLDDMPTKVIERESDAKEKFTKQLSFGSTGVMREEAGFIRLLCYCVSLNKSEGC